MSQQLYALTHGMNELILAYIIVLVPMLLGLRQGRSGLFFGVPLLSHSVASVRWPC